MTANVVARPAVPGDVADYLRIQEASWADGIWDKSPQARLAQAAARFGVCLDGIFMAEIDGEPVGTCTFIRVRYDFDRPTSWAVTTADGSCTTHTPDGDIWFGVDLSAKGYPEAIPALGEAVAELIITTGTRGFILGSRIPGYSRYLGRHAGTTPEVYVGATDSDGRPFDPLLRMLVGEVPGIRVVRAIRDYYPDPESGNNAALMFWPNPELAA